MLRVSPSQRSRRIEIIRNLADRITEARANGWRGEVQGLEASLTKAKEKLASLDRAQKRGRSAMFRRAAIPSTVALNPDAPVELV